MEKDKDNTKDENTNEPEIIYSSSKNRKLIIFKSHEQAEEYELREMAARTPDQHIEKLEAMRKFFLRQHLAPNGKWKPIRKIITIQSPKTNDEFC